MFTEIIIALMLGVSAGVITGLIPGIHINLVSILVLSLSTILLKFTPLISLGVFIIAMSVTHSFLDFIPSVFVGAPSSDTVLSILPGHKMLLDGESRNAIYLTLIGSFFSLILAILLIPFLISFTKYFYPIIQKYVGFLLLLVVIYMIFKDKDYKINFVIYILSSFLGLLTFSIPLKQPLFPLLSGLFGLSILINSLADKINIPIQKNEIDIKLDKKETRKCITASTITGMFAAFFPGLGPAQGAVIASQFVKDISNSGFMILVGGINTVNFVLSLVTWYSLDKARNGAIVVIKELIPEINLYHLFLFAIISLIAGCIAFILGLYLSKVFSKLIVKINYTILVSSIIFLIIILCFIFSSWIGLIILFTGASIGLIPIKLGTPKNHLMGCLLTMVIIYLI